MQVPEVPEHRFLLGALVNFDHNIRDGLHADKGGSQVTTYFGKPLFESSAFDATDADWWDNLVEEIAYSGLDYVALDCRGHLPGAEENRRYNVDSGDPVRIPDFIAALKRRGMDSLKIAIFDDPPASWAANRNLLESDRYMTVMGTEEKFRYPIENLDEIYPYIWDYNLKLAFQNFYGKNQKNNRYLLRFRGRPVLFIWNVEDFLLIDYGGVKQCYDGKLKAVLQRLRHDFKEAFGEDVFLCVDKAFVERDCEVDSTVVDAVNDWFTASEQQSDRCSYTLRAYNGVKVGVAVPAYLTNNKGGVRRLFDAAHGQTLVDGLDAMVRGKADLVLLEGFTNLLENTTLWRSTDTLYYDYPNQRLNILRKYSATRAWPHLFRVEVEACDNYSDKSLGNSGRQYRKGDLDVKRCNDVRGGWCVTALEPGEWMSWVELPYRAGHSVLRLRYASLGGVKLRFDVAGTEGRVVSLPPTNGQWTEAVVAEVTFPERGWYETVLHVVAGDADLNCFTIENR